MTSCVSAPDFRQGTRCASVIDMPAPDVILAGLTAISNEWRSLAIAWHIAFGLAIVAISAGWRPSERAIAGVLTVPLVSVSLLASQSGNPFNSAVFALLAVVLTIVAATLPAQVIRVASRRVLIPGGLLLLFGCVYPHFVTAQSWTPYLYASPLGLIPCPTLATLIGVSLALGLFRSMRWSTPLAIAGIVYGVIGVFRLDVVIDYALLAGAVALAAISATVTVCRRSDAVSRVWPAHGSAVSSRF